LGDGEDGGGDASVSGVDEHVEVLVAGDVGGVVLLVAASGVHEEPGGFGAAAGEEALVAGRDGLEVLV
jgi:hypothetical protein